MCTGDLLSCHKPDVIKKGFVIDRSVESVRDLALSLTDSDTGKLLRRRVTTAQDKVFVIFPLLSLI